jgi:hypothetical protein
MSYSNQKDTELKSFDMPIGTLNFEKGDNSVSDLVVQMIKNIKQTEFFGRYYKKVIEIAGNEGATYKDYIGINASSETLVSVKFYFTFFYFPEMKDLLELLPFGSQDYFIEDFMKCSGSFDFFEGGSGITFTLKYSSDLIPVFGYYFKQNNESDLFFRELPESVEYSKRHGKSASGGGQSMIYREFKKDDGFVGMRKLFYLRDKGYKEMLAEKFNEPYLNQINELEFCVGDGKVNENYRKVLMIDHPKNTLPFIRSNKMLVQRIRSSIFELLTPIAPGLYPDNDVRSVYLIDFSELSEGKCMTMEKIFSRLD